MKAGATPALVVLFVGCTGPRVTVAPTGTAAPESSSESRQTFAAIADAAPVASQPVTGRTLRYRELFVGQLPRAAFVTTWTLILGDDGRMQLDRVEGEAPSNSLRAEAAQPLGPIRAVQEDRFEGTWTSLPDGGAELNLQSGGSSGTVHCKPMHVAVLAPGALLVVPPHIHAPWRPPGRHVIAALGCERNGIAGEAFWKDEPQPESLPFVDLPGIEYAHDNDDQVVQQGALRRLPEDREPPP